MLTSKDKNIETMIDLKKIDNVELGGIDHNDYPDYVDAYIESADLDGREMTEEELDEVNENSDFVYECVMNQLF